MPTWWAEHAWLGGDINVQGVVLEVKGDRLAAVTPHTTTPPAGATVLRGVTLPGLANAHSHAFHRALRGRTHDQLGSFWTWRDLMYDIAAALTPESYGRLARAVFAEMALAGFTAVGEFHYVHHGPGGRRYADPNEMGLALMDAASEAGIRLTLLDTCYLMGGFDRDLEGPQLRFGDGDGPAWAERVSQLKPHEGTRVAAAIHSVRAVPAEAMAEVVGWAAAGGQPLHAHVSEQRRENEDCRTHTGLSPLAWLSECGALGANFTAVHGTHFSPEDVRMLARAGAGCCACPTTERDLGDGLGPFSALHNAGARLSIGTDSHAVIDGFEEARGIELHARLATEARGVLEPGVLLDAATRAGMDAIGWNAGRLEPNRLADFVTVGMDSPGLAGTDPERAASVVFAATAADVHTVVVGGVPVVAGGVHLRLPDVATELAAAIEAVLP